VEAFRRILSWKAGNFEMLPEEPGHARTIFSSYQGLLLETVQVLDEARGSAEIVAGPASENDSEGSAMPLAELSRFPGVEFVLTVATADKTQFRSWGVDNSEQLAEWTQSALRGFRVLGETLQAGMLSGLEGRGSMQNVAAASRAENDLCIGFYRSLPPETVRDTMQKILSKWAS
jgi:hypothetical protein